MILIAVLYAGMIMMVFGFLFGVGKYARILSELKRTLARMESSAAAVDEVTVSSSNDRLAVIGDMRLTLDRMEKAAAVVAENLAASVSRADATLGPEGAAADAALRTGDTANAILRRQATARASKVR